ncbi:S8 family peptidase [Ideonella sp. DXS29W]|uniref:S8 family peptidase n=1 Tax=Ideonella lacteola TaxID=2984193 RepID=A0ABU9BR55_9BURK
MKKFSARTLIALAAVAAMGSAVASPAQVDADLQRSELRYVASEVLVQFRAGHAEAARDAVLNSLGAKSVQRLRAAAEGELHRVSLPQGVSVQQAIRHLRAQGAVRFVEPNWIYTHQAGPNDPYYQDGSLWGVYGDASPGQQNQYGSQAAEAWAAGKKCSGKVVVAIIDEGVMTTHPDTQANIWVNPKEIAGNGIDDDGNGFIDDVNGWDFENNDNSTFDGVGDDHGTHVSGTIGAVRGNGIGTAGICGKVKMVNAKFLGANGGTTANAILAIDYITDLKTRQGLNLVASNNSWGGGGFSQALKDAIDRSGAANILFIAAAGNGNIFGVGQNTDNKPNYPSAYTSENIIAVASLTKTGAKSGFSNYGLTSVDLGAPGSGIWSTVPKTVNGVLTPSYASYDGTSMATPHVTGAVALYASLHPGLTAAEIKAAILAKTVPTDSLAGKTVTGGRLDVSGY